MIGKRDVVEIKVRVLRIERAPAAVGGLHADDPVARTSNRIGVGGVTVPVQQHADHSGVVDIGVVRVFVLECPAARREAGPSHAPVARDVVDLPLDKPGAGAIGLDARLGQRVSGQAGVPDRRQAGLAPGAIGLDDQQLAHRAPGGRGGWVIGGIAEGVKHHYAVGDCRVDAAKAVIAVQPLDDERHCLVDRGRRPAAGEPRLHLAQDDIDALEDPPPGRAVRPANPVGDLIRRRAEQLRHMDVARIAGARLFGHQHQQGHDHRARPVRHLAEVEWKPQRQMHDLQRHDRHGAPRHLPEQRELGAGEHVAALRPAGLQDCLARAAHVRRVGIVADRLQREIRLDAAGQVERAVVEQRPAAVRALHRPQVNADLALQCRVDPVQEVLEQHIFRRDGRIGLQLEDEVAVVALVAT